MATQLNDVIVRINNEQIAYTADTLSFSLGKGEAQQRAATAGGGQVELIYSQDLSTKIGMVKVSMPSTEANIALVKQWKSNRNQNVIELAGDSSTQFTATFSQMALVNDPEFNLSTDGNIELDFQGNPAV